MILAAMNGHLLVVNYLAHMSADIDAVDSSGNSVIHYAGTVALCYHLTLCVAAYGWKEIVKHLLDLQAKPNAFNSWKSTPLSVAMGKGHLHCVSLLMDRPEIDVNVRDDEGKLKNHLFW